MIRGGENMNFVMLQDIEPRSFLYVNEDCTACGHCRSVCQTGAMQGEPGKMHWIDATRCINCGHCLINCKFGAITNKSMIPKIRKALADPRKVVVIKDSPAIRPILANYFQIAPKSVPGKIYTALRELGFDKVYNSDFNADLGIMEEGTELIHRLYKAFGVGGFNDAGPLPQFTSWCPAWAQYAEIKYPGILSNISSARSPQQMFGKLVKNYAAHQLNVNPGNIFVVSIVSCIARKYEAPPSDAKSGIYQYVDAAITANELIEMLRDAHIDLSALPEGEADILLSAVPGEENKFGLTSGIMEAALKVTYELLSGEELAYIDFKPVPGMEAVKETSLEIPLKQMGKKMLINVCIIPELKYADQVISDVLAGRSKYHFIEVMSCPGGCINGSAQPFILENFDAKKIVS